MNERNAPSSLRGQGMTEYIIIVALIAIAAIGVFQYFGQVVRHQAAGIGAEMAGESAKGNANAARMDAGKADRQADKGKGMGEFDNDDARGDK